MRIPIRCTAVQERWQNGRVKYIVNLEPTGKLIFAGQPLEGSECRGDIVIVSETLEKPTFAAGEEFHLELTDP